jgi:hypothetical protein
MVGKKTASSVKKIYHTSKKPFVFHPSYLRRRPETCHRPSVQTKNLRTSEKPFVPRPIRKTGSFVRRWLPSLGRRGARPGQPGGASTGALRKESRSPNVLSGGLHPLRCRAVAPSLIGRPGSPPCRISRTIYAHLHIPAPPAALLPCDPAPYLAKGLHPIPRRRRLVVGRRSALAD